MGHHAQSSAITCKSLLYESTENPVSFEWMRICTRLQKIPPPSHYQFTGRYRTDRMKVPHVKNVRHFAEASNHFNSQ